MNNNPSLIQGNVNPSTTIDFTAGLGYGLICQPVIGTKPSLTTVKSFFSLHRRRSRRIPAIRAK